MDHRTAALIGVAFLLLLALNAVRRSKSWYGVFMGSEPLYFTDLPSLLPHGIQIHVLEAPNAESFPNLELAKQLLGQDVSVIYYRSQHPKGVIETMDIWAQGKRGKLLRFEAETCVGYAGIGPNPVFRAPSPEAKRFADIFGNRVRRLALEQRVHGPF